MLANFFEPARDLRSESGLRPDRAHRGSGLLELNVPVGVGDSQRVHRFDPFLADVEALDVETSNDAPAQERRPRDPSDLDTVVVPSHEDGFKEVFLGENRWWSVRIHPAMLKQLKYVAVYRTAPISAITLY